MMTEYTEYIKKRLCELDEKRAITLSHINGYRSEIEKLESEIKVIDIRISELELVPKDYMPSCVTAPIDDSIQGYIDDLNAIVDEDKKPIAKIDIKETPTPVNGYPQAFETKQVTGKKNGKHFELYKKNEFGLANEKNVLRVTYDTLIAFANEIKKRKQVHHEDTNISVSKYNILACLLDEYDGFDGEFKHIKYQTIPDKPNKNVNKKYLVWVK